MALRGVVVVGGYLVLAGRWWVKSRLISQRPESHLGSERPEKSTTKKIALELGVSCNLLKSYYLINFN